RAGGTQQALGLTGVASGKTRGPLVDGGDMTLPGPDAPQDPASGGIPAYLPPYVVTALAAAPEVAALDLEVRDIGGALLVRGTVESGRQREAALQVARDAAAPYQIRDDISVLSLHDPPGAEDLS